MIVAQEESATSLQSLQDLLDTTVGLKLYLNEIAEQPETFDELQSIEQEVRELEINLQEAEAYLLAEQNILKDRREASLALLMKQNLDLKSLLAAIPTSAFATSTVKTSSKKGTSSNNNNSKAPGGKKPSAAKSEDDIENSTKPKVERVEKKQFDLITVQEFASIPSYIVGRLSLAKINEQICELNLLCKDKEKILSQPEGKLTKQLHREIYYESKRASSEETKGYFFITEKELKGNSGSTMNLWTSSKFSYGAKSREILTVLRTIGKMKEIRGGGLTRFLIL